MALLLLLTSLLRLVFSQLLAFLLLLPFPDVPVVSFADVDPAIADALTAIDIIGVFLESQLLLWSLLLLASVPAVADAPTCC